MSADLGLKQHRLPLQCDCCDELHRIDLDPLDMSFVGHPEGWILVKLVGFSTDAIFEYTVCSKPECRDPILRALGFDTYEEYESAVSAVAQQDYAEASAAIFRADDSNAYVEEYGDDPNTIDALLESMDTKGRWDVN